MMTIEEMNNIRKEVGWTYQKLCRESGVPIGTIQKVLGGVTKNPSMKTMRRLEDTLREVKRGYDYYHRLNPDRSRTGVVREKGPVYSASSGYLTDGSSALKELEERHLVTAAERETLPDDRRTELIDGVLYDMASPSMPHQDISKMICRQIDDCIRNHRSECHAFMAPADVCLDRDEYTMVQPDVFVICDRKQITRKNIQGAPAFILEVLSPSTRNMDFNLKYWKYVNAGVREYWIVDPDKRKVIVFDMAGNDDSKDDLSAAEGEKTAQEDDDDHFDVSVYGFSDRIPLAISKGRCVIDMNPIRETLDELYPEDT